MNRIVFGLGVLASVGWAAVASAANPYRDRHFAHYALHDDFDLQDFHRHSYASGYPATTWSRVATVEQVKPLPPLGELPPVPLPPEYEYRRRDYEYYREIMPGSPSAYPLPTPAPPETSPSDIPSPWRSSTGQPGHVPYTSGASPR
jgi:hypothetical protein